jgi:hypothetical protein
MEFTAAFEGTSGLNDKARLEKDEQMLKVIFSNSDFRAEKMLVTYKITGKISNLESGNYTLQIIDANNRLVAEDSFTIP